MQNTSDSKSKKLFTKLHVNLIKIVRNENLRTRSRSETNNA